MTDSQINNLNILHWNCHSLYSKLSHFKIKLYTNKPHLACLCETWLKDNRIPKFVNYKQYFECRTGKSGGGVSILVHNELNTIEKKLLEYPNKNLEIQAITVVGKGNKKIDIVNLYNPNKNVSPEEFRFYFNQLSKNKIILGDFNAHHNLWDSKSPENQTGKSLAQVMFEDPDLCLLKPRNFPTYFHVPSRKFSTLDLCIVSSEIFQQSKISLADDLGSDHSPINININFTPELTTHKRRINWIFKDKAWSDWSHCLPEAEYGGLDLEGMYAKFRNNLLDTSSKVFKKTKEIVSPKFS